MNIIKFLWQAVMQAKNNLMKSFRKVAVRATLAVMMTVGVLAPSVTVMGQTPANPQATMSQTIPAPEAGKETSVELQFARVKDVEALAKQYPALSKLPAELKEYDEQQGGDNPAFVEVAKYTDKANGREMLFVHVTTPVLCSYEGCPLSVFLRDGKDFRNVLQVNASDPISVVTKGTSTSVMLPGAYGVNPSLEFRYDIKTGQFESTRVANAQQQSAPIQVPAPLPAPSSKK